DLRFRHGAECRLFGDLLDRVHLGDRLRLGLGGGGGLHRRPVRLGQRGRGGGRLGLGLRRGGEAGGPGGQRGGGLGLGTGLCERRFQAPRPVAQRRDRRLDGIQAVVEIV